jgi:hypothetical protein
MHDFAQYLRRFYVDAAPDQYVLGVFEQGRTVYKQQVRALNLVHGLDVLGRVQPPNRFAIVGAGISGLTAAAAALLRGYRVHLFERRPIPCHLQHGCDTRWLHPNIYHWPDPGSESPYASLPVLDWTEGTASDVTRQILKGWDWIRSRAIAHGVLTECFDITAMKFDPHQPTRIRWKGANRHQDDHDFAAVIFCVGYGTERAVDGLPTLSYWQNDALSQLEPGAHQNDVVRIAIAGTGDGAFIDLLRSKLSYFRQGLMIRDFIGLDRPLLKTLEHLAASDNTKPWYDRLQSADDDRLIDRLKDRIEDRLRHDTAVVLFGEHESFRDALNSCRVAFLHRLLTFCLYRLGEFEYYKCGLAGVKTTKKPNNSRPSYTIQVSDGYVDPKVDPFARVVVRYGTDIDHTLANAGYQHGPALRAQLKAIGPELADKPMWQPGDWTKLAEKTPVGGSWFGSGQRIEFIAPATAVIATTFVQTLASVLMEAQNGTGGFRLTLHRVTVVNEVECLQQVADYGGTRSGGPAGRIFLIDQLTIGLCARLGQTVLMTIEEFEKDKELLRFAQSNAETIKPEVRSVFACPFFSRGNNVCLVLYIDADKPDFFRRQKVDVIYAACRGFVENLDALHTREDRKVDFLGRNGFSGHVVEREARDVELRGRLQKDQAEIFSAEDVQKLSFQKVDVFDIVWRT